MATDNTPDNVLITKKKKNISNNKHLGLNKTVENKFMHRY